MKKKLLSLIIITLLNNISFGTPNTTREKIIEAAQSFLAKKAEGAAAETPSDEPAVLTNGETEPKE